MKIYRRNMSSQPDPPASAAGSSSAKEEGDSANASLAQGEDSKTKSGAQGTQVTEDFPTDSENPFKTAFCASDTVLIVEGKKLHTHRQILSLHSPYFGALLSSQHFREAKAKEIELKGSELVEMKYDAVVKFLLHLYPVHSYKDIPGDKTLLMLFPLADYFQCQHIRIKCESYIRRQLGKVGSGESFDSTKFNIQSTLLYLLLCEKHNCNEFIEHLKKIASHKYVDDIESNVHYRWLTTNMQKGILQMRARYVESTVTKFSELKTCFDNTYLCASCQTGMCPMIHICKPCVRSCFEKVMKSK